MTFCQPRVRCGAGRARNLLLDPGKGANDQVETRPEDRILGVLGHADDPGHKPSCHVPGEARDAGPDQYQSEAGWPLHGSGFDAGTTSNTRMSWLP